MNRIQSAMLGGIMFLLGIIAMGLMSRTVEAQGPTTRPFHVNLNALPASLTSPTSDEGNVLNTSVSVETLILSNMDASSHAVSVRDCQSTPYKLFDSTNMPAGVTWTLPLGGARFRSCFKWSADSTTVQGMIVGAR
jgi:hypothetical protein